MIKTRTFLGAAAVGLMGAGVLGACAPAAPPTVPDPEPDAVTTTTSVELDCTGTGIIGPLGSNPVGPIALQTVDIDVTLPGSVTDGEDFDVLVDIPALVFAAEGAPSFVNLNEANIIAEIDVVGANGPALVGANGAFTGNGTGADLNEAGTTATAAAGTNTVETAQIRIQSGSTGFVCTPTGAGASASVDAV